MTQYIITIENDADASFLRKLIKSLKGVSDISPFPKKERIQKKKDADEWMHAIRQLAGSNDPSSIDMEDERARYIMRGSKTLEEYDRKKHLTK